MSNSIRIAVLISGGGTTLENLATRVGDGSLQAQIVSVISSNPGAYGLERAKNHGLPASVVDRRAAADVESFSAGVWGVVERSGAELVCLAGFLCLLRIPERWSNRVVNIHPALLPSFGGKGMYGLHVHRAVIEAGCKVSGCTVHYCDSTYDTGPIILQRCCPVLEDDTPEALAERVAKEERIAFPDAINLIAAGRVRVDGRRTRIQSG